MMFENIFLERWMLISLNFFKKKDSKKSNKLASAPF